MIQYHFGGGGGCRASNDVGDAPAPDVNQTHNDDHMSRLANICSLKLQTFSYPSVLTH